MGYGIEIKDPAEFKRLLEALANDIANARIHHRQYFSLLQALHDHPIVEQGFGNEVEVVEERLRVALRAHHLHHELVQVGLLSEGEDLAGELAADALAAIVRAHQEADLTEVADP